MTGWEEVLLVPCVHRVHYREKFILVDKLPVQELLLDLSFEHSLVIIGCFPVFI